MNTKETIPFPSLNLEPWACLPEGSWRRPLFFKYGVKESSAGYEFLVTDWQSVWSEDISDVLLKNRIALEYPSLKSTPIPDVLSLLSRLTASVLAVKQSLSDQMDISGELKLGMIRFGYTFKLRAVDPVVASQILYHHAYEPLAGLLSHWQERTIALQKLITRKDKELRQWNEFAEERGFKAAHGKSLPFDAKIFEEKTLEEMKSSSAVTSPSICLVSADTTKAWKRWTEANSTRRVMAAKDNKVAAVDKKEVKQEMSVAEMEQKRRAEYQQQLEEQAKKTKKKRVLF